MVEYLYDAIRAVAGQENTITAYITDDEGNLITEGCCLVIHDYTGLDMLIMKAGVYDSEAMCWNFTLAPEDTIGFVGRHLYCIQHNDSNLCFKQPIYFV